MWSDHEVLTPNRGHAWPWEGHVHPLDQLPDSAIRGFVERDRDLWELARRDPDRAVQTAIEERIFFRRNEPRLGEPIYRSPENAALDRQNVHCGRGTGHLGTGLYFFGTLQAAADTKRLYEPGADLRGLVRGVYLVDMEHVPAERIYMPTADETRRAHDFASALICWPAARRRADDAEDAVDAAQKAFDAAQADDDGSDDDFYAIEELRDVLRDARHELRQARVELQRRREVLDRDRLKPNVDVDELISMLSEVDRTPIHGRAPIAPWRRPAVVEAPMPEVEPLPKLVGEAIARYVEDVEMRRFPGFHPMTYYMQERGYEAVLHASWGEFNSGDIGNLWYP